MQAPAPLFDVPDSLRLAMRAADSACERVSLAYLRGDLDDSDLWYWLALYQAQWTAAAYRLACMGLG